MNFKHEKKYKLILELMNFKMTLLKHNIFQLQNMCKKHAMSKELI